MRRPRVGFSMSGIGIRTEGPIDLVFHISNSSSEPLEPLELLEHCMSQFDKRFENKTIINSSDW
jgi:hypothetical protein